MPTPQPTTVKEGDFVPGKGTLLPDGTYSGDTSGGGSPGSVPGDVSTATDTFQNDFQKGLANVKTKLAEIRKSAEALATQQGSNDPGDGIVSSSDSQVSAERGIQDLVGQIQGNNSDQPLIDAHNQYIDILEKEQQRLEQQRTSQIAGIENTFKEAEINAKDAQSREAATQRVALQRIGGFLGNSASSTGAILNLAKQHRLEIDTLRQKKLAAIQEANNAINASQFKVAQSMAQQALDLESEINTRRNNFFNQTLNLLQEQRAQEKFKIDIETARRKANEPFLQVSREAGIINLMAQGITDPIKLFDYANFTAEGIQVGDLSLGEIKEIVRGVKNGTVVDAGDIVVKVGDNGALTGTDKFTGEVIWQTAPGVGKTGSSTPNINLTPIADPVTGTVGYIQTIDKNNGQIKYTDAQTGGEVDPSSVQLKEPQDAIDRIIDAAISGSLEDLNSTIGDLEGPIE